MFQATHSPLCRRRFSPTHQAWRDCAWQQSLAANGVAQCDVVEAVLIWCPWRSRGNAASCHKRTSSRFRKACLTPCRTWKLCTAADTARYRGCSSADCSTPRDDLGRVFVPLAHVTVFSEAEYLSLSSPLPNTLFHQTPGLKTIKLQRTTMADGSPTVLPADLLLHTTVLRILYVASMAQASQRANDASLVSTRTA